MSKILDNINNKELKFERSAKIVIVQSEYHSEICQSLTDSCLEELRKAGAEDIEVMKVPGAWELAFGCNIAIQKGADMVIPFGCIIKGETPHFDFIAKEVARGIMDLSLENNIPIVFGVLTTLNLDQAKARIKGGARGDKGVEVAQAAIKMINLKTQ